MKPKDLKRPFIWEERRPLILDRVLYVPEYYDKHHEWTFPNWNDPILFGNDNPVYIEYCTGNGAWIEEKARLNPNINWVAVEILFERVQKIWSKIQNHQLKNLFLVSGEAETFTKFYLRKDSVESIYVNFPDPWPKLRHAKHRLIKQPFVSELARVVKYEGKAIFVTDDPDYSCQMSEEMLKESCWKSAYPAPFYTTEWENYGTSYFDRLWRDKGKTIRYLTFINKKI